MGSARPMPPKPRDAIVPQRRVDQSRRHEHGGLRGGVGDRLQQAARQRAAALEPPRRRREGERKHQEEIADLRQRRVGDQELQSLLAQRDDAAEHDRRRAKRREQLRGRPTPGKPGITSNQSRTTMKKDPFTTSADSTALAAAGAPAWAGGSHRCSGKSAVLASKPDRHQRGRDERRRLGVDPLRTAATISSVP